jgi:hypothetical protein
MPRHLRLAGIASGFLTFFFSGTELLAPHPASNLETGWPSYTPGHWVAQVPRDRHFPYPLTWAPEGILRNWLYFIALRWVSKFHDRIQQQVKFY